jgi:hypothetical protein
MVLLLVHSVVVSCELFIVLLLEFGIFAVSDCCMIQHLIFGSYTLIKFLDLVENSRNAELVGVRAYRVNRIIDSFFIHG